MATANTGSFLSTEEIRRNVPNRPDTFVPRGPMLPAIRRETKIVTRLLRLSREFKTGWWSNWTYGYDADGNVIGERWAQRDSKPAVIEEESFRDEAELKGYALWAIGEHWIVPRVIPSRLDA